MPTVSVFYGIMIRMFYNDHAPPHFHAIYNEYELVIGISPVLLMAGAAPNRVRSLVAEWAAIIWLSYWQAELLADWERCRQGQPPAPIEGLV